MMHARVGRGPWPVAILWEMTDHLPLASPTTNPWLTRAQAAQYAQVSEATIGREVRAGRLRSVKVGGRRAMRLRPEWIDQWLEGAIAA
jgi:excisionase family DNA binding protein